VIEAAPTAPSAAPLSPRTATARRLTTVVNGVSRWLGLGSGTVIGGRTGLAIDPHLVERLSAGRRVVLVSGTNGKTTTTALLAAVLAAESAGGVVTNGTGSNMPAGHTAALAAGPRRGPVVLEVDEAYLPVTVARTSPAAVVLLNLSRDQLDRTNEVRMLAARWRDALGEATDTVVVANADDPLVAFAAGTAPHVVWVSAGMAWHADASGCPACDGRITFAEVPASPGPAGGWGCHCGHSRPAADLWVEGDDEGGAAVWADGRRLAVRLRIPGRFNRANAVVALGASEALGIPAERAFEAMADVREVAGRFTTADIDGVSTRLLLAKNPAGWSELLGLVCPGTTPVVVGINARVADGRDPSWLWDVEFERLAGRPVVATGDRCRDLSVRLRYAEVDHLTVADPVRAVEAAAALVLAASGPAAPAGAGPTGDVDFIGNYTAFTDLVRLA